jgi:RNA polymerase sigma-70 factor (ECF subfamily)
LASLPEDHRQVLVLFDLEGYTHEEIHALLGIPAGTSKSRLFAARRALRERLSAGARPRGGETR